MTRPSLIGMLSCCVLVFLLSCGGVGDDHAWQDRASTGAGSDLKPGTKSNPPPPTWSDLLDETWPTDDTSITAPDDGAKGSDLLPGGSPTGGACTPHQAPLTAAKVAPAGTVTVTNDATTFTVTIKTSSGFSFRTFHVYAGQGPVPTDSSGDVDPELFPVSQTHANPVTSASVSVPLQLLKLACGDEVTFAVHVELIYTTPNGTFDETGWAEGPTLFSGSRWGWSFRYEICCSTPKATPPAPKTTPPEVKPGCTRTQGYWKNHAQSWPLSAGTKLCGTTWLALLQTPPKGDARIILAHQWIAARLNVAAGASAPAVSAAIKEAGALLATCGGAVDKAKATSLAALLDAYNNGKVGPGHCK